MFKIDRKDIVLGKQEKNEKVTYLKEETENNAGHQKIETCYFCLQKFDINKDDLSHYKYGKFPMCDYCSQFYGFYE